MDIFNEYDSLFIFKLFVISVIFFKVSTTTFNRIALSAITQLFYRFLFIYLWISYFNISYRIIDSQNNTKIRSKVPKINFVIVEFFPASSRQRLRLCSLRNKKNTRNFVSKFKLIYLYNDVILVPLS